MPDRELLRIGFVSDRSMFRVENRVWTDGTLARLIEALSARCAQLWLALSPAPRRMPAHDTPLEHPAARIVELPWVPNMARGFFRAAAARRAVEAVERETDVLFVQMPFAAVGALRNPARPRVYHVCANIRTIVSQTRRFRGVRRLAAELLARTIDRRQHRLIQHPKARLLANGSELLARYGSNRGRAIVSSAVRREEIGGVRRARPVDGPFRVLFVGFLRREKGVDTLLEAFERLLNDLPDAELEVVGASDWTEQGITGQLRDAAERIGRRATVRLRGHIPYGPELFQAFADADVCCVPSRSEGTPRVLVDARAFGCPVIGTRVGGIPDSIADGIDGLLVPPDDSAALHLALAKIAFDAGLRSRLIAAGYERAHRTTVDHLADAILEECLLAVGAD